MMFSINSLQDRYSPGFVGLLRNCLSPDPKDRPTLEQLAEGLAVVKQEQQEIYCIRFEKEDNKKLE